MEVLTPQRQSYEDYPVCFVESLVPVESVVPVESLDIVRDIALIDSLDRRRAFQCYK